MCAAIVCRRQIYSQKFSQPLNFLIAGEIEFFQADPGTRKRRIVECFGSLGWTSVHPRELCESGGRRSGFVQSAGDCLPQGAPIVRRRSPPVRVLSCGKRPGWGRASFVTTCLLVDPLSSLRSAADRAGNGKALGPTVDRKGVWAPSWSDLGCESGRRRGWVERRGLSTGLGLPKGSRSSLRSWGFARVRYDGLDLKSRRFCIPEPAGSERRQERSFRGRVAKELRLRRA